MANDNDKALKDDRLVRARNMIQAHWEDCKRYGLVGRCWGKGYNGSTIVLGNSSEIIVISLDKEGYLQVQEFTEAKTGTGLGYQMHRLLEPLFIRY